MIDILEILKAFFLGIIEGITEWLPISSTGHMILVDTFLHMKESAAFMEMFLVVIQLGAILAVVVLYWRKLNPFSIRSQAGDRSRRVVADRAKLVLWLKILIACVPAGLIGVMFNDEIDALFYNDQTVAITLIVYGVLFILVELWNRRRTPTINALEQLPYKTALLIGVFQLLALVPGTSRSGATILGAILIGTSRSVAAEFTFFLAIPVMFGASLVKLVGFGFSFTANEMVVLLTGMVVAFAASILAIRFLVGYIKQHDFRVFGWYRIGLGLFVLILFRLI